jgi:putative ABC transport system permease protein
MNSIYVVVNERKREFATLGALGFAPIPIAASVIGEAIVIALPAAVIGAGIAWLAFNNQQVSPMGRDLALAVTPHLAMIGVLWALIMGVVGGIMPALHATRIPVAEAFSSM